MSDILLSVQDLSIEFVTPEGVTKAVNNISFDLKKGETLGIVGESGSGKSVTSLAIMKLLPSPPARITSGDIIFNGKSIVNASEKEMRKIRGNDISMIFQEPMTSLNPVFTIENQLIEVILLHKDISKKEAIIQAIDLLDQVGIPNPAQSIKKYPHEMSGGQKQRVIIAMAIACEPKLLIADEPTTALDVTIQKQVLQLLKDLQKKYGMAMLFITHDLGVVAEVSTDVMVMYRGYTKEKGTAHNIFKNAQHPYTKGLLACRPRINNNPKRLLTVEDFMDTEGHEIIPSDAKKEIFHKKYSYTEKENPVLLEVKNLNLHFPIKSGLFNRTVDYTKAVDNVSFKLRKGKTLGLVGESGCGKTTLGRSILQLIQPTSGEVYFNGTELTGLSSKDMRNMRTDMQMIFQDPYASLNPRMTIGEIIREPMVVNKIIHSKSEQKEKVEWLLEKVGLKAQHLSRYPHEFSGGQRQRISIARSLAVTPSFIVCDESVSALDVSVQSQVLNLLLDLQEEFGLTYIFISHDMSVINFISDEIAVMHKGKIIELNSAEEIYHNPQEEYTKKLLSAIPKDF